MTTTYGEALTKVGVSVPDHLIADAEVPILTGPQAQGDLLIVPIKSTRATLVPVPAEGVQLVVGEATGNSHWLHRGFDSPDVTWARATDDLCLAVISVPAGQSAQVIHTDEHGANGVGPGLYAASGSRRRRSAESPTDPDATGPALSRQAHAGPVAPPTTKTEGSTIMATPTGLLTPAEVAAAFKVDVKTVARWARAGKLHPVRTPGGHRRYSRSEIEALLRPERAGVTQ